MNRVAAKASAGFRRITPVRPIEPLPLTAGSIMEKRRFVAVCETTGSALAIAYALLIASNTGLEILGFSLLLASSGLFAAWAVIDKRWAFLALQFFYAVSATIGLIRWA